MTEWDNQEGGNHYKDMKIQPSKFIYENGLDWLQGNIIKYVCRFDLKGDPMGDLEKAKHYLNLLIEEVENTRV
jgi:hypothetical protein